MSIESPCTKICVIEPVSGHCRGCGRSGAEIGGWIGYSAEQRRAVMAVLPARVAALSAGVARPPAQSGPIRPTAADSGT